MAPWLQVKPVHIRTREHESEEHPLTDGERAVVRVVQGLMEVTPKSSMVTISILLNKCLGNVDTWIVTKFLKQLCQGEDLQLVLTHGPVRDELCDAVCSVHVVWHDIQRRQVYTTTEESDEAVHDLFIVSLIVLKVWGKIVRDPG